MHPHTLVKRVETLERTMSALDELPARVEALEVQFLQFREEVRSEFSAVRSEFSGVRSEFSTVHNEFSTVRSEFSAVRQEIRDGDEETRRQLRILHEEVIGRFALLQEAYDRRSAPAPPSDGRRKPRKR